MLPALVAVVVFVGVGLALASLEAGLRLRARARAQGLRRRVLLGQAADAGALGRPSLFLEAPHRLLARPAGVLRTTRLGLVELTASLVGLLVGLLVLGWPFGLLGLGFGLVPAIGDWRRRGRVEAQLVHQLPGAIEVLVSAMRAGHAFSEALRLAAGETPLPLRAELLQVVDEHALGLPLRDGILGIVDRHPTALELRLFASAVTFQQEAGGNLVELLEQLAGSIQDRVLFEDKARAITADVRMSTNVLAVLPIVAAVAVLLIVPHHFDPMLGSALGRLLLAVAAFGLVGGTAVVHGFVRSLRP